MKRLIFLFLMFPIITQAQAYTLDDWLANPQGFTTDPQSITAEQHRACQANQGGVMGIIKMTQEGIPEHIIRQTYSGEKNREYWDSVLAAAYALPKYPPHLSESIAAQLSQVLVMECFLRSGGQLIKFGKQ